MKIYVDADACPVTRIVEDVAKARNIPVTLICDTNHVLNSSYSEVIVVGAGADAADFALVNRLLAGDIVVTQDYGVAAMALGRGAKVMHQNGIQYQDGNIDQMLFERHLARKARASRGKHHMKGPKKRTKEDDIRFRAAFERLLDEEIQMNMEKQIESWREEERIAHIHGWDFSHINERYEEENDLPWDYKNEIQKILKPSDRLLDIDTGGGEFVLSIGHPYENLSVTEGYYPNYELCLQELSPLGIDVREADAGKELPFEDGVFDVVINRHGDFLESEIFRVLKSGGVFITQQVGAENDRELVDLLLPEKTTIPFPEQYLSCALEKFTRAGFQILKADECFRRISFYDVGALVWFARIIEWEFPGFSVDACLENLINCQKQIDRAGSVDGRTHRFFMIAKKPKNP